MKKKPQLPDVTSPYGAPMGRASYGNLANYHGTKSLRLFEVRLDYGGYDEGGAYWGISTPDHRLWCAMADDGECLRFARASCRNEAAFCLDIKSEELKSPLANLWRHRFKVTAMFAGHADGARFYIYQWGKMEKVSFATKNQAIDFLWKLVAESREPV